MKAIIVLLGKLLKGHFKLSPETVSIIKLLVTIVLLVVYLLSGDLDGLLGFLVGNL